MAIVSRYFLVGWFFGCDFRVWTFRGVSFEFGRLSFLSRVLRTVLEWMFCRYYLFYFGVFFYR